MKHFFYFNIPSFYVLLVAIVMGSTGSLVCEAAPNAKTFTLVIDAGHGGKDAGAVGKVTKEKVINLNVALAFGRLVERNCPDIKVVYTRKTDVFVPLEERANIANKAKADLFISIHTNAVASNKANVSGAETYTLGMHRAADNLEVAKRENSVITYESDYKTKYQGFDPNKTESYIIFELMQDRYLSESIKLAKDIQQHYSNAGRRNKGVHQAGFLVLRETSMPSVLTELGFISNANEEQYLNSQAGVDALAECLFRGLQAYRKRLTANAPESAAPSDANAVASNGQNLPPVYVAPDGEPSIRPVATTPYLAMTETPQEQRTVSSPADVADNGRGSGKRQQTSTSDTGEKLPPLASSLNMPPEKEEKPATVRHEEAAPRQHEEPTTAANAPSTAAKVQKEKAQTTAPREEKSPAGQPQTQKPAPARSAEPEIDPRTGQKLPPLASSLNLPPENGNAPSQPQKPATKPAENKAQAPQGTTENAKAAPKVTTPKAEKKAETTEKKQQQTPETKSNTPQKTEKKTDNATQTAEKNTEDHRPIFKIQLFTSSKALKDNDPRLKGLKADCYNENGVYKYTYGETTDYQEIQRLKKDIADKFHGTFIVAFVDGKRTDLNQAIQNSKKK